MRNRFAKMGKLQNVPDKRWWLELSYMNPEARATVYWNRYRSVDDEQKNILETYKNKVPGITGDRFYKRLSQLKAKTPSKEELEEQPKIEFIKPLQ